MKYYIILLVTFFSLHLNAMTTDGNSENDPVESSGTDPQSVTTEANDGLMMKKFALDDPRKTWLPGIRFGVNWHTFSTENTILTYDGNRFGINGGVFLDYQSASYTFQTGIAYSLRGASTETDQKATLHYIEVPFRWNIHLFQHEIAGEAQHVRLVAEPYGAYALDGNLDGAEINFRLADEGFKQFDYGLRAGLSMELGPVDASLIYDLGIRDIDREDIREIFNRGVMIQVMYIFGK